MDKKFLSKEGLLNLLRSIEFEGLLCSPQTVSNSAVDTFAGDFD